jgi:predicted ester cyclase
LRDGIHKNRLKRGPTGKETGMTDPKAVVGRFYEIVNEGAVEKLDEVCAPHLVGHAGAGANLIALKMSIGSFCEAFPDLRAELRHVVREDDLISTWINYEGTHQGEFAGVSGSDRPVKFAAWDLFRIDDGRIVEITQYCDVFTLMNQIGALPTAAPA